MRISGIYKIVNKINGHFYIGSSIDISRRWRKHKHLLRLNTHHNSYLQNAWIKYGEDNFEFLVLESCDKQDLILLEQKYIDSKNPEYNILPIAGSRLGLKHSDETKKKLRLAKLGKPSVSWNKGKKGIYSNETLSKMSTARIGMKFSEEHRHNLSISHKGKSMPIEQRHKISASVKSTLESKKERNNICEH